MAMKSPEYRLEFWQKRRSEISDKLWRENCTSCFFCLPVYLYRLHKASPMICKAVVQISKISAQWGLCARA